MHYLVEFCDGTEEVFDEVGEAIDVLSIGPVNPVKASYLSDKKVVHTFDHPNVEELAETHSIMDWLAYSGRQYVESYADGTSAGITSVN